MHELLALLEGGDRRSIGNVNAVIAAVEHDPSLIDVLFQGMLSEDPLIRMRAADAIEKITRKHLDWLQPYKEQLLTITILEQVMKMGSPAAKSRGRKLLRQLTMQRSHEERKTP